MRAFGGNVRDVDAIDDRPAAMAIDRALGRADAVPAGFDHLHVAFPDEPATLDRSAQRRVLQHRAVELARAHPARVVREVRRAALGRQALEELEPRAGTVVRDTGLVIRDEAEHVVDVAIAVIGDRAGVVEHHARVGKLVAEVLSDRDDLRIRVHRALRE